MYDATSNKRYSLSEQTAKIVKGLKEDAKITYFDQGTRFERAKDQLDLYAKLSRRVHVDFVDVDKKPQLAREAGIKSYGTTMVQMGAKREEAKGTSEEDITGALIRAHLHHGCAVALDPGFAGQLWFLIHIYEVDMNSARELGIQVQLIFGPLEAGALVKISDLGVLF